MNKETIDDNSRESKGMMVSPKSNSIETGKAMPTDSII